MRQLDCLSLSISTRLMHANHLCPLFSVDVAMQANVLHIYMAGNIPASLLPADESCCLAKQKLLTNMC